MSGLNPILDQHFTAIFEILICRYLSEGQSPRLTQNARNWHLGS